MGERKATKALPPWAKQYTKASALVEARRLLGPTATVRAGVCRPFTRSGSTAPTYCSALSAHPRHCQGNPSRPVYRVGFDLAPGFSQRGVGATWVHALAAGAFGEHRFGCLVCDTSTRHFCANGAPLWKALEEATPPPGFIQYRVARETGLPVGVYHSVDSGIEVDPATPYATLCEDHGGVVCHATLADALAWASKPKTWCPTCQGEERDPHGPGGARAAVEDPGGES